MPKSVVLEKLTGGLTRGQIREELSAVANGQKESTRERLLLISGWLLELEGLAGETLSDGALKGLWERLAAAEKHDDPRRMADALLTATDIAVKWGEP